MPKKYLTLHQKAVARSQRISELHKQSKDKPLEENAVQTNENEQSSKCKLRDVKNNKKKNDKKELSKLLFAKEVPDNPQNPRRMDPVPVEKNNASNEENQEGYNFVKPAVKKEEKVMKIPNNYGMNKLNNAANKNPTPKPPGNEEKHVINLPTNFGSEANENLSNVPKGRMNYQDLLNTSSTSYFKYFLDPAFVNQFVENSIAFQNTSNININTNVVHSETTQRVQNTGVSSNSAETECIIIMEILCKFITENEMRNKFGLALKNNIFSSSEMKQIKYIEEQLLKLSETSQQLDETREKLTRLIQFHGSKQLKNVDTNNCEEIIVKCDNGSVYKIKETDVTDTIKKVKAREGELVLIDETVKNELSNFIKNLPNDLKNKLLETAAANPVKNTEQLTQVHKNNTTNCINTKHNDSPLKLTRKQKKNKKKENCEKDAMPQK